MKINKYSALTCGLLRLLSSWSRANAILAGPLKPDTSISNRVSYAQALTDGVSVYQTRDGQAKAEIDLIVAELENAKWL